MHRLYDETCAERWARRKHEELVQEARVRVRYEGLANPAMDSSYHPPRHRHEDDERKRRRESEQRSRDDDTPTGNPFATSTYDPAPPTAPPDPPSTIDPGGGSSGGAGASGDW